MSSINEWIRHADAKAAVTLAFVGALGTMVFDLTRDASARSLVFDVTAVAACVFLVMAAWFCGCTLNPRLRTGEEDPGQVNRLFFASIAKHFEGDRAKYAVALAALTSDSGDLLRELADQIHANARIATVKTGFAKRAIWSALCAGASVGALALIIGIASF
ncbi:Pycsar system effector family protein [Agrococcus sp. UYP33]